MRGCCEDRFKIIDNQSTSSRCQGRDRGFKSRRLRFLCRKTPYFHPIVIRTSNCKHLSRLLGGLYVDFRITRIVMNWQNYIHSDPKILVGKPTIKNTRLSVDFILGLFAEGWTEQQILENYPTLTPDALKALFAFVAKCMKVEALYSLPKKAN